jgi:SSS family solute:Na+ symporter
LSALHYAGACTVLLLTTLLGLYSGIRVKSAEDFTSAAHKANSGMVAGSIIGTLVGGASTIGTAQLAFLYGFSAWMFTLGGGLACLVLACFYSKPIYKSGVNTIPQILSREYGQKVATAVMILTSLGSFLSIISQVLSSTALITSVSAAAPWFATALSAALMIAYVAFGGVWGTGIVGMAKTILLCLSVSACGLIILYIGGGLPTITNALPAERYFNLLARGATVDIGACLSLVLGIVTTQAYLQAFTAGSTLRVARSGLLIGTVIIPLIGIPCVMIGLYMKVHAPDINPAGALPLFVLEHLPPFVAGMVLATLLVTVVGTAAGVTLGLSSMFCLDIYRVYFSKKADDLRLLLVSRLVIVSVLTSAALISAGNLGSLILGWSFLSMALRGAVAFGVLTTAIFLPGRIPAKYAMWSLLAGPACLLAGKPFIGDIIDPLFFGVAASLLVLLAGFIAGRQQRHVGR